MPRACIESQVTNLVVRHERRNSQLRFGHADWDVQELVRKEQ